MSSSNEFLFRLSAWLGLVASMGVFLGYFVHWLLVSSDYRDYQKAGGTRDILGFRRLRGVIKKDYRRQKALAATHRPHSQVAVSLGEQVFIIETGRHPNIQP